MLDSKKYGNLTIPKSVLKKFSKINGKNIEYDKIDKCWKRN